jgi:hypothetical protein
LQTDTSGVGLYANCVHTGFDLVAEPELLVGRAFIIHAEDGSRISCGLIEEASSSTVMVLETETTPIPGDAETDGVSGSVQVLTDVESTVPDGVCYQGYAINLEPNVESFLLGTGSDQCDVTNGCGAHIHAGTGCENTEEQGGHYYDADGVAADPWLLASYLTTNDAGMGAFVGCVITGSGAAAYDSKPFIVHGTDGSRLSCGILSEAAPTSAPTVTSAAATMTMTTSSSFFYRTLCYTSLLAMVSAGVLFSLA